MAEPALQPTSLYPDLCAEEHLPYTDGHPMPDSDHQAGPLSYASDALKRWYVDRMDVAVQQDMFVHYLDHGERHKVAPDVFVIFGVPKKLRDSYIVWREGRPPDFVLEILSRSTWRRDVGEKKAIYRAMGVTEYWMLEATDRPVIAAPLMGYRLVNRRYRPIKPVRGTRTTYVSRVLGLELRFDADREELLRLRDPATGIDLPTSKELAADLEAALTAQRHEAEARRIAEERAREAERRLAELTRGRRDAH